MDDFHITLMLNSNCLSTHECMVKSESTEVIVGDRQSNVSFDMDGDFTEDEGEVRRDDDISINDDDEDQCKSIESRTPSEMRLYFNDKFGEDLTGKLVYVADDVDESPSMNISNTLDNNYTKHLIKNMFGKSPKSVGNCNELKETGYSECSSPIFEVKVNDICASTPDTNVIIDSSNENINAYCENQENVSVNTKVESGNSYSEDSSSIKKTNCNTDGYEYDPNDDVFKPNEGDIFTVPVDIENGDMEMLYRSPLPSLERKSRPGSGYVHNSSYTPPVAGFNSLPDCHLSSSSSSSSPMFPRALSEIQEESGDGGEGQNSSSSEGGSRHFASQSDQKPLEEEQQGQPSDEVESLEQGQSEGAEHQEQTEGKPKKKKISSRRRALGESKDSQDVPVENGASGDAGGKKARRKYGSNRWIKRRESSMHQFRMESIKTGNFEWTDSLHIRRQDLR